MHRIHRLLSRQAAMAIVLIALLTDAAATTALGYSGSVDIRATRTGQFISRNFPGTAAGLQAAIDTVAISGGSVQMGPGILPVNTTIWLHGRVSLNGSADGSTEIVRNNGTMSDADANFSGAVLAVSRSGFNGTPADSDHIQHDISISNLILNGNAPAFSSITNSALAQHAVYAPYVDGLHLFRVTMKQTMRSGLFAQECRNVTATDCQWDSIGQWSVVSTQNAVDFYNYANKASSEGHGKHLVVLGGRISNVSYEAFSLTNVSDVTVIGTQVEKCKRVFEVQGGPNTGVDSGFVFVGVNAYRFTQEAVSIGSQASGRKFKDVKVLGCNFIADPALHSGRIVSIEPSTGSSVEGVQFIGDTFRNANSANSAAQAYIDFTPTATTPSVDVQFIDCTLEGGNMAASNHGIAVTGNVERFKLLNDRIAKIPGVGIYIHPLASQTLRDIQVEGCTVDSTGNEAIECVENATTNGSIDVLRVINNEVISACRSTGSAGIRIGAISASGGGSVTNASVEGNRIRNRSGSSPTSAVRIEQGAGGTTDKITLGMNFGDGITNLYNLVGTPTNVIIDDPRAAFTNSTLPSTANGVHVYCSDCTKATPCAGAGSGAVAWRINGAWDCNP